jgi:magnesium-transporting ATPase (P-type)
MDEIESNLEIIGVTAIEDKLQDEVPESIAKMISAGVKVWMITGDKQETAINIAVSCRLFNDTDSLLICNADSKAKASERMSTVCISPLPFLHCLPSWRELNKVQRCAVFCSLPLYDFAQHVELMSCGASVFVSLKCY